MTVKALQNPLRHFRTAKSLGSNSGTEGRRRFGLKAVVLALVLASASVLTALATAAARQPTHTTTLPLIATTIATAALKARRHAHVNGCGSCLIAAVPVCLQPAQPAPAAGPQS